MFGPRSVCKCDFKVYSINLLYLLKHNVERLLLCFNWTYQKRSAKKLFLCSPHSFGQFLKDNGKSSAFKPSREEQETVNRTDVAHARRVSRHPFSSGISLDDLHLIFQAYVHETLIFTRESCDIIRSLHPAISATESDVFGSLLTTGRHLVPGVSQSPRHYITEMGWDVTLRCDLMPGHLYLYWYRQTLGKGMEFLMSIYNKEPSEKAHFMEDCFSAEMPNGAYLILKMHPAQLGDLAMFLCASSLPTALQRCFLALSQTPQCLYALLKAAVRGVGEIQSNKNVTTGDGLGKSKHAQRILRPELLALNLMGEDRTDFSEAKT
ncbi:hypothetical protein MJG53_006691 [Ovis ammon polii x Ovis aries]|uniref:Uncharacterized protein n=1 Tax=Ovis ammon polii x Ovis aries TaxID=2918886 RepID=A0ACB9V642_9CETA|nr:hypothetical protein MJG53_006691 [Ovis ammon polii x Ovis aries]